MEHSGKISNSIKTLLYGTLWIVAVLWFLRHSICRPFDDLALIRQAQTATGTLVESYEYEEEDHRSHIYSSDVGVYTFNTSDGREFKSTTRVPTGDLSKQQDVEYLPYDPSVNRIKGDGATSIFDWAWRKFALGLVLLAAFLSPGVILLRNGYRDFREAKNFK